MSSFFATDLKAMADGLAKEYNVADDVLANAGAAIQTTFGQIDANGDGMMSPKELYNALTKLTGAEQAEMQKSFIQFVDGNGDGAISIDGS